MTEEPLALNVPLWKSTFPPKVIGVPVSETEAADLLTVKVPMGRVPAVRVELDEPIIERFADPRAPSREGVISPETLRVPELIRQLAAQPEKA